MIINNTDISIVEETLDLLLGFYLVDSSFVFNKLNKYLEKVNRDYSLEYKLIYRKLKDIE